MGWKEHGKASKRTPELATAQEVATESLRAAQGEEWRKASPDPLALILGEDRNGNSSTWNCEER